MKQIPLFASRALLLAVLLSAGCQALMVREEEKPLNDTVLMVSRGSDEAVLSWTALRGVRYMVLYADTRSAGARWQPLPHATLVTGTGETVTVKDVIPADRPRYYRLEIIPASGRKP